MTSLRQISIIALPATLCLALVAGCDKKPSEDECNAAADHYLELLNADMGADEMGEGEDNPLAEMNKEMRDGMQSDCTQNGTQKWLECAKKASSVADFEGCEK